MNNITKVLIAFGAGAVAGAALGILFAPEKGTDTRKKINEQGKKLADTVNNAFEKIKDTTRCKEEPVA